MKVIILDTETTGLNPETDRIHELAGFIRIDRKVKEVFNLKGKESDIYQKFVKILDKHIDKYDKKDKSIMVGYNVNFDSDFIREMFKRNDNKFYGSYFFSPALDILQMAVVYFLNKPRPENFKLVTICKKLGIKINESKLHTAMYDATITKELYNILRK